MTNMCTLQGCVMLFEKPIGAVLVEEAGVGKVGSFMRKVESAHLSAFCSFGVHQVDAAAFQYRIGLCCRVLLIVRMLSLRSDSEPAGVQGAWLGRPEGDKE